MKILVAISGGIDSSAVAYMLKKEGHDIEGVYMKLHNSAEYHRKNIEQIEKVCNYLGIKYHVFDISKEFDKLVYDPFIKTYKEGLTPNPCILCNRNIKLGALVDFARNLGFEKLATGHYAKIQDGFVLEAKDKSKDQSYFLANIKSENIRYLLFPLGNMLKNDVKEFASEIKILKELSKQKESSEICFVETTYLDVLKEHINVDMPGFVLDKDGNIVGRHKGYMRYTIGKRRGFEVKGAHDPHYVLKINAKDNTIVVGKKEDLNVKEFKVKDVSLFVDQKEFDLYVKIRYRGPKVACSFKVEDDKSAVIYLKENAQGLAPGQMAVFYDDDKVIGGGWII